MTFLQKHHGQMSDSMLTAFFIILSGGLQDAYTYCCRGKVFANAQTGNIVLLSTHLFEGDWGQALRYLVPVLAFLLVSTSRSAFTGTSSGWRRYTGGSLSFWRRSCCWRRWASCRKR